MQSPSSSRGPELCKDPSRYSQSYDYRYAPERCVRVVPPRSGKAPKEVKEEEEDKEEKVKVTRIVKLLVEDRKLMVAEMMASGAADAPPNMEPMALSLLILRHSPMLLQVGLRTLSNTEDPADVAGASMAAVRDKIKSIRAFRQASPNDLLHILVYVISLMVTVIRA